MEKAPYRTVDIARTCSIHPNTVRFYECIGFLSPVRRDDRGYRIFADRELARLCVISVLRKSGHSIAVIHRALYRPRQDGVSEALATFEEADALRQASTHTPPSEPALPSSSIYHIERRQDP